MRYWIASLVLILLLWREWKQYLGRIEFFRSTFKTNFSVNVLGFVILTKTNSGIDFFLNFRCKTIEVKALYLNFTQTPFLFLPINHESLMGRKSSKALPNKCRFWQIFFEALGNFRFLLSNQRIVRGLDGTPNVFTHHGAVSFSASLSLVLVSQAAASLEQDWANLW